MENGDSIKSRDKRGYGEQYRVKNDRKHQIPIENSRVIEFGGVSSISSKKILSGKDVLQNFEKHLPALKDYELHQLSVVNDGIFRHLEVERLSDKAAEAAKHNLDRYFDFLADEKKEAAAHFATLYVNGTYPKAVAFIARECPMLTMTMCYYVKSIE